MSEPTQLRMHRYKVLKTDNPNYVVGEILLFQTYKGPLTKMTYEHKGRTDVVRLKWVGVTESSPTPAAKGTS